MGTRHSGVLRCAALLDLILSLADDEAIGRLERAARIVIFGVGPTALLAEYAAFSLRRSGRQAYALNRTGIELADQLLDLHPPDVLLVLAYGRAYPRSTAQPREGVRFAIDSLLEGMDSNSRSR